MESQTTVDSDNFRRAVHKMRKFTGQTFEACVNYEASVVLPKIATKTGKARADLIKRRYTAVVTKSQAKANEVPKQDPLLTPKLKLGGSMVYTRSVICDPNKVMEVKRALKDLFNKAKNKTGLSKSIPYQWAEMLNLTLAKAPPAFVAKAMSTATSTFKNLQSVKKTQKGDDYTIDCETKSSAFAFGAGGKSAIFNGSKSPRWSFKTIGLALDEFEKALVNTGIDVAR